MVTIILSLFIGILSGCMDRTNEKVAFNNSIFSHMNKRWWLREESWKHVKFIPFTKYRPDAWHLFQSMMYVCIGLCAAFCAIEWTNLHFLISSTGIASVVTIGKVLSYDYILKRNATN